VAENPSHLIEEINRYLENPALENDGRQRMFRQQLWKVDGNSAARVVEAIVNFLS